MPRTKDSNHEKHEEKQANKKSEDRSQNSEAFLPSEERELF
jgi:hypothetical protein